MPASSGGPADFTYGTYGLQDSERQPALNQYQLRCSFRSATEQLGNHGSAAGPRIFSGHTQTVNLNHIKNTNKTKYLNARMANDLKSPGIGNDGIYRDLWGSPYIITLDLNNDERARDVSIVCATFRKSPANQVTMGCSIGGIRPATATTSKSIRPVAVWSPGPDKLIDHLRADRGANKDNILSWK